MGKTLNVKLEKQKVGFFKPAVSKVPKQTPEHHDPGIHSSWQTQQ